MLNNNVPPKIRRVLILHNFLDPPIEHAKHLILRHESRLFTLKICIRSTVRKDDPRRLPRRRNVDWRNIAPPMKPFPAIPGKTRLPVIRIHPRACVKPFGRVQ